MAETVRTINQDTNNYNVNPSEYDYVLSFFKQHFADSAVASQFTDMIIQLSIQLNLSATDIVSNMNGKNGIEIEAELAYYINGTRSNSSLLGVAIIPQPNFYVSRAVII